jgi:Transglutaminase-like superfamily
MFLQLIRDKLVHYCLTGECLWELLRARQMLLRKPFDTTVKNLRRPLPVAAIPADAERVVRKVRGAMGSIYRWVPWKPTCLVRAVAARQVLARRMIVSDLVLSVTPASGKTVDAHAWLEAGGLVVTGRNEKAKYVPIYTFSNAAGDAEQNIAEEGTLPCSR